MDIQLFAAIVTHYFESTLHWFPEVVDTETSSKGGDLWIAMLSCSFLVGLPYYLTFKLTFAQEGKKQKKILVLVVQINLIQLSLTK